LPWVPENPRVPFLSASASTSASGHRRSPEELCRPELSELKVSFSSADLLLFFSSPSSSGFRPCLSNSQLDLAPLLLFFFLDLPFLLPRRQIGDFCPGWGDFRPFRRPLSLSISLSLSLCAVVMRFCSLSPVPCLSIAFSIVFQWLLPCSVLFIFPRWLLPCSVLYFFSFFPLSLVGWSPLSISFSV